MLIKTLEKINVKTNQFAFNLFQNPYYFSNLKIGESLSNGYVEKVICDIECAPLKKAFTCYDKIYVQLSTGEFCGYDNGTTTELFSIPGDNKVYELNEKNKNRALVYGSSYGRIIDTETNEVTGFAFPNVCLGCAIYDGSLFGYTSKKVYFSSKNLITDFVNGGYFSIPNRDGKVISLQVINQNLFVICQKAIYKVFRNQTSPISIVKLNLELNVLDKSVAKVGEKVYFINQNNLSAFDGEKVVAISTYIDNKTIKSLARSGEFNGLYFFQATIDDESITYFYNPETAEQICSIGLNALPSFGGICVSKTNNKKVAKIDIGQNPFTYKTFPTSLEKVGKKTIKSIRLNTLNSVTLTVYGDFGQESYQFDSGYTKKNCNLTSSQFVFEVKGQDSVGIDNFIIEYKVKGE